MTRVLLPTLLLAGGLELRATAAEVTAEVAESGLVQAVTLGGVRAVGGISLTVPQVQWRGAHGSLRDAKPVSRQTDPATGAQVVRGQMPAAGEPCLEYSVSVARDGDGLRLQYELTPRQDLDVAAVVVQLYLPIEQLNGKEWVVRDLAEVRAGTFPRELPAPYTFFGETGFEWLAWPVSDTWYLALVPDWTTVSRVSVQDDRQFKGDSYEVQLYLPVGSRLGGGQAVRASFGLKGLTASEVKAARAASSSRAAVMRESLTGQGPATLRTARPLAESVPAWGVFELAVDLQAEYQNPFDPADVSLEGHFTTPAGAEEVVPGFLAWGFARSRVGTAERLLPNGKAGWAIRYCPRQPGTYRYWVALNDGTAQARTEPGSFTVTASDHPGMVRVSRTNKLYFEFDNGTPYFAIGENVCWPGPGGTFDYDNYWKRLAENGANYARLWIGPFDCFTLERTARDANDPAGLGRIDLAGAWRVDYVLDLAEKYGIKVMFCIDSFNSLRISPDHAMWKGCPYNAANGGPIATPQEFFTNSVARDLFKRRLRYIVARWAHHPALLSWEFWNEVDIIEKYVSADSVAWHREMARHLRSLDAYAHLITTSWARPQGDAAVDALPELDYIQSHQYGARDAAAMMGAMCRQKAAAFGKPHYFGEFGTGTRAEGTREDTEGIHLHNGLWSGVMCQAAGTAMLWWWDNYVEPHDLYHHFRPVAEFVRGIPFNRCEWRPLTVAELAFATPPAEPRLEALDLVGTGAKWEPAPFNEPNTFVVEPSGTVAGLDRLARVLHGTGNHPKLHNPATFEVDYPRAGQFVVQVSGVSGHGGANLQVSVDGTSVLAREFPDQDQTTETLNQFNGPYAVAVPAGRHRIVVQNTGKDWVYVSYRLPDYRRRNDPGLHVYGLQAQPAAKVGELAAILWVKNEHYTWYHHNQGEELDAVAETRLTLADVADGGYSVEWWDPQSGKVTAREPATAAAGRLVLRLPAIHRDLAAKLSRPAQ